MNCYLILSKKKEVVAVVKGNVDKVNSNMESHLHEQHTQKLLIVVADFKVKRARSSMTIGDHNVNLFSNSV